MDALTVLGAIVVVVPSITSHEAMHGFVADRLGDPTARLRGRLTLNPLRHIDPFFTILLPAFLILSRAGFVFGGAKPVPVDVSRLRRPRRDWALVGAAGPATNLVLALLFAALLSVGLGSGLLEPTSRGAEVLVIGIFVNVLLAVFNLIPIPPLDGSRVVQYFLSAEALAAYRRLEQFGLLVIVVLVFFVPPVQVLLSAAILWCMELVSLPFGVWGDVQLVLQRLWLG
jgi:Zn-dependent protease